MVHPSELVADNDRYIASARRHCLLIFAVGLLSAQLAWSESDRKRVYDLFSYLEKSISIVSALQEDTWEHGESRSFEEAMEEIRFDGTSLRLLKAMTGDGSVQVSDLNFKSPSVVLSTRADPTNACDIRAFHLVDASGTAHGEPLALDVKTAATAYEMALMVKSEPDTAVIIGFSPFCPPTIRITDPIVVVRYGKGQQQVGVVFSRRFYDRLGIEWRRETHNPDHWRKIARSEELISEMQEARLIEFDKPLLEALDFPLVKGLILKKASELSGQTYRQNELDRAIKVILEGANEQESIWGLRLSPKTATLLIPLVFLTLSFLTLHRVRRINPKKNLTGEPWIIFNPAGLVEVIGAVSWYTALLFSGLSVAWSVWTYQSDDWQRISGAWKELFLFPANEASAKIGIWTYFLEAGQSIVGAGLVWGLVATMTSLVLIGLACKTLAVLTKRPGELRPVSDAGPSEPMLGGDLAVGSDVGVGVTRTDEGHNEDAGAQHLTGAGRRPRDSC